MPLFEEALGSNQYFGGSLFTALDVVVGYSLHVANKLGFIPAKSTKLKRFTQDIESRPLFKKAFGFS